MRRAGTSATEGTVQGRVALARGAPVGASATVAEREERDEEPADMVEEPEQEDGDPEDTERRHRSTQRRPGVPALPQVKMEAHTVGRVDEGKDGRSYRPSMFLTFTLTGYGPVHTDGTPKHPDRYDYRRAAMDALNFSKLFDRFIQNLRRRCGFNVQYFASVEPQRRLAPHVHVAIRGVIPRRIIREVVAATYFQLWWPTLDPVDFEPGWNERLQTFAHPDSGRALPTWTEALDALDDNPNAEPVHMMQFGRQLGIQGILAGGDEASRHITYLTKYLSKSMTQPLDETDELSPRQSAHAERLHEHVRELPCSPSCANWLTYGVQPKEVTVEMSAGVCRRRAHSRDHMGYGGRRVLVSRRWTGKTLTEHRADRTSVVRAALEAAGIEMDDHEELAAMRKGASAPCQWTILPNKEVDEGTRVRVVLESIRQRRRWRRQYQRARDSLHDRPKPHGRREAGLSGDSAHR